MEPREPIINSDNGIAVEHNQRCCVLAGESAVYSLPHGIFKPSWEAQRMGYKLVRACTPFQKFLLKFFFSE